MSEHKIADLGNVEIAYNDIGEGKPILLIHGFASNARINWVNTSWVKVLNEAGYRCIALDNRGHGHSTKFYSPDDYGPDIFAADAIALLDHLGIEKCDVLGFSMGARITAWICATSPERVNKAIFGGMGARLTASATSYEDVAHALETDDLSSIESPHAANFRTFADRTKSDRLALAACIRPSRAKITPEFVASITTPVLVAVGDLDEIGGSAVELADTMQNAQAVVLKDLDHMRSTGAKPFKDAVLKFLAGE